MRLVFVVSMIMVVSAGACFAQLDPTDSLSQGVKSDKPNYELGQTISLVYAIRNDSSGTIVLHFPSAKQFDIWVSQGDGELFRASKATVYPQTPTSLMLKSGESRTFCAQWNQMDQTTGKQVGPGVYTIYAQLPTSGKTPAPVTTAKVRIGLGSAAMVPTTVCQAIANAPQALGRKVMIAGTYRGTAPDSNADNTKAGPPVSRSDWAICDATGCIYVTGTITLDSTKDVGAAITVVGRIARTDGGQVYLILLSATTSKGSVCPT